MSIFYYNMDANAILGKDDTSDFPNAEEIKALEL